MVTKTEFDFVIVVAYFATESLNLMDQVYIGSFVGCCLFAVQARAPLLTLACFLTTNLVSQAPTSQFCYPPCPHVLYHCS